MDSFLLLLGGAVLLAIAAAMVLLERAALAADRRFVRNDYTQQTYWMIYLSFAVLGATLLLKAAVG
jgi:hypothetical protein